MDKSFKKGDKVKSSVSGEKAEVQDVNGDKLQVVWDKDTKGKKPAKAKQVKAKDFVKEEAMGKTFEQFRQELNEAKEIKKGDKVKENRDGAKAETVTDVKGTSVYTEENPNKPYHKSKVVKVNESTQLDEAKKPKAMYDLSDFPEDGIDDLMDTLGRMGKAKQGKDWDLSYGRRGQMYLELYSNNGVKAAESFFGKDAPEKVN